jgi:hypothetical protein
MTQDIKIDTYIRGKSGFIQPEEVKEPIKGRYLEGSICLEINNRIFLDPEYWDDVSGIWYDITEGLISLSTNQCYSFSYPDQPIRVSFTPHGKQVCVSVSIPRHDSYVEAFVDTNEFVKKMQAEGEQFCSLMLNKTSGVNKRTCKAILDRLDALKTLPIGEE